MRLVIKKKIVIPLLVLILVTGGFFWWWEFYETPPEKWSEAEYSPPGDYEVIETPEGTFIENKKAGISFKVPDGWRVEKEEHRNSFPFSPISLFEHLLSCPCEQHGLGGQRIAIFQGVRISS